VIQAISGWAGAQRTADGPSLIRGMVADKVAALTTSQAITAALFARNETGECQHVQVSMLEANIAFNWPDVMMHETVLDDDALHLPNLLGSYQLFSTSDGWVSVTAGTDSQWKAVCSALSRDDLANDERFSTAANRSKHFTEWYASFDEMLSAFTTLEALQKCQAADVPAVRVLDPSEVAHDIHVKEVGSIAEIDHPIVGKLRVPRQGAIFNNATEYNPRYAPAYCQDTTELLTEIGYSTDEIEKMKSTGSIS
ncbi:MAG: CoA transferase, partial [Actinomycetota bacterium]|nr:CoA transferase [Actinomycetota bacterium]